MTDNPTPRHRWYQIGLGRFIVSIGLMAIALACIRLAMFDEARPARVGALALLYSVLATAVSVGVLFKREVAGALWGCGICLLLIVSVLYYLANYAVL